MENELFDTIKEELTLYGKALGNVGRLRLIGIISRVLGLFLLIFTIVLCVLAIFSFAAVAAINALSMCMPVWAASLIVGSTYLLLIIIAILCRKQLFFQPFIALLSKQLINTPEELEIETLKAEHEVELQNVRLETRIDNATRELNFYTRIVQRLWRWLTRKD